MMPYGASPMAGAACNQCGCNTGANAGYGQQTWPGTFPQGQGMGWHGQWAAGPGMAQPWMGPVFGGPPWAGPNFFGYGQPQPGFGAPGFFGANAPWQGYGAGGYTGANNPIALGWGLGGLRRAGGSYSPQFMNYGLPTDEEISEMIYDAIDEDPLIPYDADINVDTDAGTVTITGTVPSKQIKHAAGDDAWWIPGVDDVHNDLQVAVRRTAREGQQGATGAARQTASMRERTTSTSTSRR